MKRDLGNNFIVNDFVIADNTCDNMVHKTYYTLLYFLHDIMNPYIMITRRYPHIDSTHMAHLLYNILLMTSQPIADDASIQL